MNEFWKYFDEFSAIDYRVSKEDLGDLMAIGTARNIGNRLLTEIEKEFIKLDSEKYEAMARGYVIGFTSVGNVGAIEMLIPLLKSENEDDDKAMIAIEWAIQGLNYDLLPKSNDCLLKTIFNLFEIFGLTIFPELWLEVLPYASPAFLSEALRKYRHDLERVIDGEFLELLCCDVEDEIALVVVSELIQLGKSSLGEELVKRCCHYQRGVLLDYIYTTLDTPPQLPGDLRFVNRNSYGMRPSLLLFLYHQGRISLEDLLQTPHTFRADYSGKAISECLKSGAPITIDFKEQALRSHVPVAVLNAIHAVSPYQVEEIHRNGGISGLGTNSYLWAIANVNGMSPEMKAECLTAAWERSKTQALVQFMRGGKTQQVVRKLWY